MEGERRARGDWLFRNGDVCVVAEYSIEIEERERERVRVSRVVHRSKGSDTIIGRMLAAR